MSLALVLLPLLASLTLLLGFLRHRAIRVLVLTAVAVSVLASIEAIAHPTPAMLGGFVRVDATSRLFLAVINPIFLGVSVYVWNRVSTTPGLREGIDRFVWLALAFLGAANAVLIANHFLVLWIALEATTLAAAPLIVRPGSAASRLASWRYLLFSSVGLALVLLGFSCLMRGIDANGQEPTFFVDRLGELSSPTNAWRKLGLALVILGLGTKLGLAPMYTWLPEAYDEAPPSVTALLGAVQFNCALVMLIRVVQVYRPGNPALVSGELLLMGIVSMVVSTFSLIGTRNMKRLIAYASINHAGVIAIGLGIGKTEASYGVFLYVVSNAFIKAILFLTAGKIEAHYRSKDTRRISGLLTDLPYSGVFLMVGTVALLGLPPFGSFFGELLILSALVSSGQMMVFAAFCVLITMSFVATGRTIFPMIWGEPKEKHAWPRQTFASASPKIAFLLALVVLGLYIPPVVNRLLQRVASDLGGVQ
jgi:hydrogenase-4 component F